MQLLCFPNFLNPHLQWHQPLGSPAACQMVSFAGTPRLVWVPWLKTYRGRLQLEPSDGKALLPGCESIVTPFSMTFLSCDLRTATWQRRRLRNGLFSTWQFAQVVMAQLSHRPAHFRSACVSGGYPLWSEGKLTHVSPQAQQWLLPLANAGDALAALDVGYISHFGLCTGAWVVNRLLSIEPDVS